MKTKRKSQKPKRESSAGADAPEEKGTRPRKEAFDLAEADSIHDLMDLNGPKVTRWALQCVQKVARGRASLLEQKIALMMIQKCTPSTGRKGEEGPEEVPEGTTKDEMRALNALIAAHVEKNRGATPTQVGAHTRAGPETTTYKVSDRTDSE